MSIAVIRSTVISILAQLDVIAPKVLQPSIMCWMAAVNYRLEEGTVEMDALGRLRFRFAMPVVMDHGSSVSILKYMVQSVRYNAWLIRSAARHFCVKWESSAASGQPPSFAAAVHEAHELDGLNGQLTGPLPSASIEVATESTATSNDGFGAAQAAFAHPSSTDRVHTPSLLSPGFNITGAISARLPVSQSAPRSHSARGAPTPFNSPVLQQL